MTEETNSGEWNEEHSSEPQNENTEQPSDSTSETREEEATESEEPKRGLSTQAIIFLILFILSTGLLVYYQFYDTGGKWRFSMVHKPATIADTTKKAPKDTTLAPKDTLAKPDSTKTTTAVTKPSVLPTGTVYMVQIGTFEGYDLSKFNGQYNKYIHEETDGKLTKLTLGEFEKADDAKAFLAEIKKMGVKGAWIVKIVDGVRQKGL